MSLRVETELVLSPADFAAVRQSWNEFVERPSVSAGFYTHPAVIEARLDFPAGVRLRLARITRDGRIVAVIPLVESRRRVAWRFGSIRLPALRLRVAVLPDFDFAREMDAGAAFGGIAVKLRKTRDRPDLVIVESVAETPANSGGNSGFRLENIQSTYVIDVNGGFDDWWRGLTAHNRLSIKSSLKKFEKRATAAWRLECYRSPSEMPELHDCLEKVFHSSWHAAAGGGGSSGTDFLTKLAERGWMRSYILFVAGMPVASVLGYQYCGVYYYDSSAYDHEWRTASPGIALLYQLVRDVHATDVPARIDFGFGYNVYKRTFGTREEHRGIVRVGLTPKGRIYDRIQSLLDITFRAAKRSFGQTRLAARWKRKARGRHV